MHLVDMAKDVNIRGAEEGIISMVKGVFHKDENMKNSGLEKFRFHMRDYYLYDNAFAKSEIQKSIEADSRKIANDKLDTDKQLENDVDKYFQFLMHTYWEVHDLGSIGVSEPPKGCPNCHDQYIQWRNRISMKPNKPLHIDSTKALDLFSMDNFTTPAPLEGWKPGNKKK